LKSTRSSSSEQINRKAKERKKTFFLRNGLHIENFKIKTSGREQTVQAAAAFFSHTTYGMEAGFRTDK
jgi:hypothetical protein